MSNSRHFPRTTRRFAAALSLAAGLAVLCLLAMPAATPQAADPEPVTHDVDAVGADWVPAALEVSVGDTVRWNFPAEAALFPHDVWLVAPGGDPAPGADIFEVTDGFVLPGGESVSYTIDQPGTWIYVCRIHAAFTGGGHGGQWAGMVGTITAGDGSEIDFEPYERPDPALPAVPGGEVKKFVVDVYEHVTKVADHLPPTRVWSFGVNGKFNRGTGVSQPIVIEQGDEVELTLRNGSSEEMDVTMPHSIDLHAAKVAPNEAFVTIQPGETHTFTFTAQHPGVFMYHCATAPILHHVGAGMAGLIVVKPQDLAPVDRELWIVQQEYYLGEPGGIADLAKMLDKQPDVIAFNGYANQYATHPIDVEAGETIRMYVLNAGPTVWSAFHVIGTVFDRAVTDNGIMHSVQTINLAPSQGGFVEFTLDVPGEYPFVNHSFGDMVKGSVGVLRATESPGAKVKEPRLELSVTPQQRRVGAKRKRARFRVLVANVGTGPTGPIRLCATAAKRGIKVKGASCIATTLAPGVVRSHVVAVSIGRAARGKVRRLRIYASGPTVGEQSAIATLAVRKR